jgi:RNA-dependent RNA polymerase
MFLVLGLDPTGTLKPNEIFYKSSKNKLPLPDGSLSDIILGDVLLTRHPCKLPTDIQRVSFAE